MGRLEAGLSWDAETCGLCPLSKEPQGLFLPKCLSKGSDSREADFLHGGTGLFRVQHPFAFLGFGLALAQRNPTAFYWSGWSQGDAGIKAGGYARCDYRGAGHRGLPTEQPVPEGQVLTWTQVPGSP